MKSEALWFGYWMAIFAGISWRDGLGDDTFLCKEVSLIRGAFPIMMACVCLRYFAYQKHF